MSKRKLNLTSRAPGLALATILALALPALAWSATPQVAQLPDQRADVPQGPQVPQAPSPDSLKVETQIGESTLSVGLDGVSIATGRPQPGPQPGPEFAPTEGGQNGSPSGTPSPPVPTAVEPGKLAPSRSARQLRGASDRGRGVGDRVPARTVGTRGPAAGRGERHSGSAPGAATRRQPATHASTITKLVKRVPREVAAALVALALVACGLAIIWGRERQLLGHARHDALTDPLTGLANRLAFEQRFSQECKRADRYGRPLGVVMLDLDRFKRLNDSRGHAAGDRALREAASVISTRIRDTDFAARIGGDEFVVLCPETSKRGLETLRDSLGDALSEVSDGASIGVSEHRLDDTPEQMLNRADEAMYRSKERRRFMREEARWSRGADLRGSVEEGFHALDESARTVRKPFPQR